MSATVADARRRAWPPTPGRSARPLGRSRRWRPMATPPPCGALAMRRTTPSVRRGRPAPLTGTRRRGPASPMPIPNPRAGRVTTGRTASPSVWRAPPISRTGRSASTSSIASTLRFGRPSRRSTSASSGSWASGTRPPSAGAWARSWRAAGARSARRSKASATAFSRRSARPSGTATGWRPARVPGTARWRRPGRRRARSMPPASSSARRSTPPGRKRSGRSTALSGALRSSPASRRGSWSRRCPRVRMPTAMGSRRWPRGTPGPISSARPGPSPSGTSRRRR